MDNDNLRGVTVSGTISSEFTLDGSSNVGSQARVAIQPPARRHPGVQGRDRHLRRERRPHRRRHRQPGPEERRQRFPRRGVFLQPRRLALGEPVRLQRARHGGHAAQLQPLPGLPLRPHHPEQDVLRAVLREAERRHHRDRHRRGADRAHAQRRLLGAAGRRRPDLRPADRAQRERRDRARPVPGQHHPAEPPQPGRAQRPRTTTRCPTRRAPRTSPGNFFAEQPWTYSYYYRRRKVDHEWSQNHKRSSCASSATSAARSATTGRASRTASTSRAAAPTATTGTSRSATPRSSTRTLVFDLRGELPALQRRPDARRVVADAGPGGRSASARRTVAALPRLLAHPDVQPGRQRGLPGLPQRGQPRVLPGRQPERLQLGPRAAVLQPADRADRHQDRGQPHLPRGLRLAQPPPERGERGLPRRPVPLRQHVHPAGQQRHRPLRPGRRRLHAGPAHERLVHRGPLHAVLRGGQPRRLHPRRLARQLQAHAQRGRALRPTRAACARARTATSAAST